MRRTGFILAALLALAACATPTPYQPLAGSRGGYAEERLGDNRYRVTFAGNSSTPAERIENYLLRRSAELTLSQGYDWFRVSDRRTEGNVHTIQSRWGPVRVSRGEGYRGWRDYGNVYTRTGLGLFGPIWRSLSPGGERLEASAEIVLGRGPAPRQEGIFEARNVLRRLGTG